MSELAKAAETVGSLFEKLLTIRYRKRREVFTELLSPIYTEFLAIHEHYTKLLEKYESSLPLRRVEASNAIEWIMTETGDRRRLSVLEERAVLKELIAEARESGTLTEPVRRLFRERAADLVSSVTSEPERRFLFCVVAYFGSALHADLNADDRDDRKAISQTISRVLAKEVTIESYLEVMQTTSIGESIEDLLLETPEYEQPRMYVTRTRRWINEVFVHVGREHQRVKHELIKQAPI